jgi:hypothetical protein
MNEEILEELKAEPVDDKQIKLATCRKITKTKTRMNNNNKMPKIMMNYRLHGRKRLGRPLKRLTDKAETCLSWPHS